MEIIDLAFVPSFRIRTKGFRVQDIEKISRVDILTKMIMPTWIA